MKKIIFCCLFFMSLSSILHAQYIPSSATRITSTLTHDGNLRIGTSTSAADRTRNVLNFGDGDYVKIGEFEADDALSFKAKYYSFIGGNINADHSILIAEGKSFVSGISMNSGDPRIRLFHADSHGYLDYKDNFYFRADKSWICPLALYGNGTVGIGFSPSTVEGDYRNQGHKLAVNGTVICEGITVVTDVPDADYVFEDDYDLKALPEVEAFIKENRHLPDIPSAEEFKSQGYKVGEMDEMLLRKVEELTLYLIEQNKRIEKLEKENNKLRKKKER